MRCNFGGLVCLKMSLPTPYLTDALTEYRILRWKWFSPSIEKVLLR
jgi:hypothetical protein